MKNIEELLQYDEQGIVPWKGESERRFLKRARKSLAKHDELVADLQAVGYSGNNSEAVGREFLLQETAPRDYEYGSLLQKKESAKFFRGFLQSGFPYFGLLSMAPLVAIGEYMLFGSVAMGVPLGLLANQIGIHGYMYLKTSYMLKKYQKEREQITKQDADLGSLLSSQYSWHAGYIRERLDHEDLNKLSACKDTQEMHKTIEQLPGLKWTLIREKLRRDGIEVKDNVPSQLTNKIYQTAKKIITPMLATLCGAGLFFETTFGYRDYVTEQREFTSSVMSNADGLIRKMEKENNMHLDKPHIKTGYRALHHELTKELVSILEANIPGISLPGIKQAATIYSYAGAGAIIFLGVRGIYSSGETVVVVGDYKGPTLSPNESYITVHELAHHYINRVNPKLMDHSLSRKSLEQSAFHEGLAEYITYRTLKEKAIMQYHRCIYASDIAATLSGSGGNIIYHKSHHYSIGSGFVEYVLAEVGEQHLETVIRTPPKFDDFFWPEHYILSLKAKLGQKPNILHPEKNPRKILERYIWR